MPSLTRSGAILTLNLGTDENRLSPAWLTEIESALHEIESAAAPRALLTCADGKYWSNGLDLDWMQAHPDEVVGYMGRVHAICARLLVLPMPSVAAVQGHAFGLGALISLAHDQRVMRADRGYWCLPEAALGLSFPPGMMALAKTKLPPTTAHEAMTTSRRYGGVEAERASIVNAAVALEEVDESAAGLAEPLATLDGDTLAGIKRDLHSDAYDLLTAAAEKAARKTR